MDGDDELTVAEVAALRGLNESTARSWVTSGRLPGHRDPANPRRWLVYRRDVEEFLDNAERPDIGRPRTLGASTTTSREDWSDAPEQATLDLASFREVDSSGSGSEQPLVAPPVAADQVRKADQRWELARSAFEDYPTRLRALADAARGRSRALMLADLANLTQSPRPGASSITELAPELAPSSDRPGPKQLWSRFDQAVKGIGAALEEGDITSIAAAFATLATIANELADAIAEDAATAATAATHRRSA